MNINSFLRCLSVVILAVSFVPISAQSQNVYCVGPVATGSGSGSDWNNIKAWSATPARGDTWYLRDGSYGGQTFSVAASGTTLITIKKAIASDHVTDTGWVSTMANQAVFTGLLSFTTSYWVVDGQVGGNWSKTPSDYGFAFNGPTLACIRVGSGSANTSDYYFYHISATAPSGDTEKMFLRTSDAAILHTTSNVTVGHCLLNGWQCSFNENSEAQTMSNWIFEYNVCLNGFSSAANHGEDVSNGYGYASGRIVRFNLFEGRSQGTGIIITLNWNSINDIIYGNVFKNCTAGNGIIGIGSSGFSMTGAVVYNNTFENCSAPWLGFNQSGYTFSGCIARNNLLYNMNGGGSSSGWSVDYGAYYSCSGNDGDSHIQTGSGDPFVDDANDNFMLKANTQPGTDLGALYNADPDGNIRGTWTRGAFEFGTLSTNPVLSLLPSTTLDFGSVLTNTTVYFTNTVRNAGGGSLIGTAVISLPLLSPFDILSGATYTLGAGQSTNLVVSFSPGTVGSFANSILLTALGGSGLTETLSGNGVASYSAPQVSAVGQSGSDVDTGSSGLQVFAGYNESYSGSASDPSGLSLTWQWIYTVNGGPETVLQSGSGTVTAVSYNYPASAGGKTYIWKLRVSNGYSTSESDLTVGVEAPPVVTSSFTFQPSAGNIASPFVLSGNYVSQPATTGTNGGQLVYFFQTTSSSAFAVEAQVDAPSIGANSFYVNIDGPPADPADIWDVPVTAGFTNVIVTWRGNGTNDQIGIYPQQNFSLNPGTHQLVIKGREGGAELGPVTIVKLQPPPQPPVVVTP